MRTQREFFQDEVGPMADIVFVGCSPAEAAAPLTPAGDPGRPSGQDRRCARALCAGSHGLDGGHSIAPGPAHDAGACARAYAENPPLPEPSRGPRSRGTLETHPATLLICLSRPPYAAPCRAARRGGKQALDAEDATSATREGSCQRRRAAGGRGEKGVCTSYTTRQSAAGL
jgi:hypothetical protein